MALLAISLSDWLGEYILLVSNHFRFWSSRGFWFTDGDISIRGVSQSPTKPKTIFVS